MNPIKNACSVIIHIALDRQTNILYGTLLEMFMRSLNLDDHKKILLEKLKEQQLNEMKQIKVFLIRGNIH